MPITIVSANIVGWAYSPIGQQGTATPLGQTGQTTQPWMPEWHVLWFGVLTWMFAKCHTEQWTSVCLSECCLFCTNEIALPFNDYTEAYTQSLPDKNNMWLLLLSLVDVIWFSIYNQKLCCLHNIFWAFPMWESLNILHVSCLCEWTVHDW